MCVPGPEAQHAREKGLVEVARGTQQPAPPGSAGEVQARHGEDVVRRGVEGPGRAEAGQQKLTRLTLSHGGVANPPPALWEGEGARLSGRGGGGGGRRGARGDPKGRGRPPALRPDGRDWQTLQFRVENYMEALRPGCLGPAHASPELRPPGSGAAKAPRAAPPARRPPPVFRFCIRCRQSS